MIEIRRELAKVWVWSVALVVIAILSIIAAPLVSEPGDAWETMRWSFYTCGTIFSVRMLIALHRIDKITQ